MRVLSGLLAPLFLLPSVAAAQPGALGLHARTVGQPADEEAAPEEMPFEPTSSKAPDSADRVAAPEPEPEPAPAPEPEPEPDTSTSLDEERKKAPKNDFNRHGIGVRGGIAVLPTWIFSRYLDAHTNALCRGDNIGDFAEKHGLLKTDGCNFYVGGEYTFRQSRVLDIVAAIGYQSLKAPDGYWLDKGEFDPTSTTNSLSAADYTEIDLSMMFIEADFVARAPLVVNDTVEFGLGGGAGIGLGILFGGIHQTAIGSDPRGFTQGGGETPTSCRALQDLADFTRCTPSYDPTEHPDYDPMNPGSAPPAPGDLPSDPLSGRSYARCTKDKCSKADLEALGYRRTQGSVPPVIPVVNLILSARFIFKDVFGLTINGGWNTGFYFGGSMQYFFGKNAQKTGRSGPA